MTAYITLSEECCRFAKSGCAQHFNLSRTKGRKEEIGFCTSVSKAPFLLQL
ncbi:hypothetical protein Mapa_010143 [Marchantia paleacea]|nr:hypothetical protein Mapa_010143 [Marchantia paleacea]